MSARKRVFREPGAGAGLIMVVWGLWGLVPAGAQYADSPLFAGLHPVWLWSAGMVAAGSMFVTGIALPSAARAKHPITLIGGNLMCALWTAIMIALWSGIWTGNPIPPGAAIVVIYLIWTYQALRARARGDYA